MSAAELLQDQYPQPSDQTPLRLVTEENNAEVIPLRTDTQKAPGHVAVSSSATVVNVDYAPKNPFKWSNLDLPEQQREINSWLGFLITGQKPK